MYVRLVEMHGMQLIGHAVGCAAVRNFIEVAC